MLGSELLQHALTPLLGFKQSLSAAVPFALFVSDHAHKSVDQIPLYTGCTVQP
jgi:hypothetical protein